MMKRKEKVWNDEEEREKILSDVINGIKQTKNKITLNEERELCVRRKGERVKRKSRERGKILGGRRYSSERKNNNVNGKQIKKKNKKRGGGDKPGWESYL